MTRNTLPQPATRPAGIRHGIVVFLAAFMAMLPALRGGFIEGDDEQLVLNFVLVSRPSLSHALELLTLEPHRYLYQPVPMLSFAAEFALLKAVGLSALPDAPNSGTWLFHLTNVLIHAAAALLVWRLIRRLHPDPLVALVAGILFAVHPMGSEPTAWVCGRMISLSALFSLLSLNLLDAWEERPRIGLALLVLAAVVLAMTSKVQVGLPVLMLLLPLARRRWPRRTWWVIWGLSLLITGSFAVLNVTLTKQTHLLEVAAERLEGPRSVRVLLALGWYLSRVVWPAGLAPFHPARWVVAWSDPDVLTAVLTLLVALVLVTISVRWTRIGVLGLIWFLANVAATLPLLPSRSSMFAERYVYISNIGLFWAIAAFLVFGYRRWAEARPSVRWFSRVAAALAVLMLVITTWQTVTAFRDDIRKNLRVAEVYPNIPGSWTRLGLAYYGAGQYEQAIEAANEDMARHPAETSASVHRVIGMAYHKMKRIDDAIEALQKSLEADPHSYRTHRHLAEVYREAGRTDEAMAHYRHALALAPMYEPALLGLGQMLQTAGQADEAVPLYERVLKDNPFHLTANLAMAEIEIGRSQYNLAAARLQKLLSYAPESWTAWTNLGVCQVNLGQPGRALESYRTALSINPQAEAAALNLAGLLISRGQGPEAARILVRALADTSDRQTLWTAYDLLVEGGQLAAGADLWAGSLRREPDAADLKCSLAWALLLRQQSNESRKLLNECAGRLENDPVFDAALAMLALGDGDPSPAVKWVESAARAEEGPRREMLPRMKQAVRLYGERHSDQPWPYYLAAR
ncbi:MAG TPA: tetratricopeptide repeat protein, partial [Phycisphaerae bacterium]|nr:tetratricopeptide repeat protein [Phycisphaerae bacterium]